MHLEAYDPETRKKQMQTVKSIYLKYNKDFPTVLLGDFNSDIHFEDAAINILLNLSDTGCAAFDPVLDQNTFDAANPTQRLDYIFYNTKYIHEVDAEILKQFQIASDHLPLLMKFKFKDTSYANLRRPPTS